MKALGYIFAALAIVCAVATVMGYTHQVLGLAICGWMALAILAEDKEEEPNHE